MPRTLTEEFYEKVLAGISGMYIRSFEHEDAVEEIRRLCINPSLGWRLATFDVDEGMLLCEQQGQRWAWHPGWYKPTASEGETRYERQGGQKMANIAAAIQSLPGMNKGLKNQSGEHVPAILICKNAHLQINRQSPPLIQLVANTIWAGRTGGYHLVILSPVLDIPPELTKLFESGVMEHRLPDRGQLLEILQGTVQPEEVPAEGQPREKVIDAACGLTRLGAETAFALSVIRNNDREAEQRIDPATVFEQKANALKLGGKALTLYEGKETFKDLGGMEFLKQFTLDCLRTRHENPLYRPRGIFLVGPPGIGKSMTAKCLGNELDRPTLLMNLGATRSKFQGESEKGIMEMTERLDAMAPCVGFIDEFEKAAAGGKSSGQTDGGVKAATIAHLLSWMNDHTSDVYLVVTCNDIRQLMVDNPEFARAGRFDAMFFLDFPRRKAKDAIWEIHLRRFGFLEPGQPLAGSGIELPDDDQWTGAEIEGCCRLARLRGKTVAEIGKSMPRIVDQAREAIDATRQWADGKCYAAEYDGIYRMKEHEGALAKLAGTDGRRPAKPAAGMTRRLRPSTN